MRFQPQIFQQTHTELANDSLFELQFPRFSNDVITRLSLKSTPAYFINVPMNVPYTRLQCPLHKTTPAPCGGYRNISGCDGRRGCFMAQAQGFAWMAGWGRLFANLTEWGQRFMATPRTLGMLGAFLLVFTPNKK